MKKYFLNILGATFLILFTGCSTSQNVPIAKTTNIDKDEAIIQVHRESSLLGGARSVDVYDFDKKVGEIGSGGTLTWARPKGKTCLGMQQSNFIDIKGEIKCFIARGGEVTKLIFDYFKGTFFLEKEDGEDNEETNN